MNLDFVFYQRPYDIYLPKELSSSEVVKHSRCCYILYGYSGADTFNGGNTNDSFFRNMSFIFQDSDYMKSVHQKKFQKRKYYKYQHNVCLGYPSLIHFIDLKKREHVKSILWTPRWSYDPINGGSHFFEYKDTILNIKKENPNTEVIVRPHPLMFDEFIKKGLMTKDDVDEYKAKMKESGIIYDHDSLIVDAFDRSDMLVMDYSSIIINYFLTGKPLIYVRRILSLIQNMRKSVKVCMLPKTRIR